MARRRVEIKKIEERTKRQITFTKRRQGLFKKAGDLCAKCDAQVAVIAFSMAGNAYAYGDPSVQSVVNRYLEEGERAKEQQEDLNEIKAEKKVTEIMNKIVVDNINNGGSSGGVVDYRRLWDKEIQDLDFDELERLKVTIEGMKTTLLADDHHNHNNNVN